MGIFVCGAEPGVRVGLWGGGGMKSLQKSIAHISSSLGRAGRCAQVCPHVTHARFCGKKLDLETFDPWALDPSPPPPRFFLEIG